MSSIFADCDKFDHKTINAFLGHNRKVPYKDCRKGFLKMKTIFGVLQY